MEPDLFETLLNSTVDYVSSRIPNERHREAYIDTIATFMLSCFPGMNILKTCDRIRQDIEDRKPNYLKDDIRELVNPSTRYSLLAVQNIEDIFYSLRQRFEKGYTSNYFYLKNE